MSIQSYFALEYILASLNVEFIYIILIVNGTEMLCIHTQYSNSIPIDKLKWDMDLNKDIINNIYTLHMYVPTSRMNSIELFLFTKYIQLLIVLAAAASMIRYNRIICIVY